MGYAREGSTLRYGYAGVALLEVDDTIRLFHHPSFPEEVKRLLVLGTGLALYFHRQGVPVLHGTTLRWSGADRIICGPSGVGKSTLTGRCLQLGAELVADDLGVLEGEGVRRGLGRIKLWEDAARWLGHDPDRLERLHPDYTKYAIPVPRADGKAPLRTVFVLRRGPARVEMLEGKAALMELLALHRVAEVITPSEAGGWLRAMVELVRRVEIYRLTLPGPLAAVDEAARWMLRSVRGGG